MDIRYNIFKDEINHKDFFLGPHVHFSMESPKSDLFCFNLKRLVDTKTSNKITQKLKLHRL